LVDNLNSDLTVKNGAPVGKYEVMVSFMVGKNGKVTNVNALTNHGFGMEAEAVRVLKKSPKWNPEIYLGKPIDKYCKQPIVFVVKKK
jgi:protein TonB